MLIDRVIQIVAENKIQVAVEAGEFDNLPGLGKPAAIFDEPYDSHWWMRRKLKRDANVAHQETILPRKGAAGEGISMQNAKHRY
jgi:hypothetical protein